MKIVLAGKKDRATACLDKLLSSKHEVSTVVTPVNDSAGFWYPSLSERAEQNNIPVSSPENINSESAIEYLKNINPDAVVLASYTQIIGKDLLSIPEYGFINLHGGKLPEYRGSSTLNWMVINGETEGGVSIIKIDEDIDTGPILTQEKFTIAPSHTIADVVKTTLEVFPRLLTETLDKLEQGGIKEIPQETTQGAYYHSRKPEDGRIDWRTMRDVDIYNLVRALTKPYPGAFFYYNGEKYLCWKAGLVEEEMKGIPGRVTRKTQEGAIVIAKNRGVLIKEIQKEDKEEQNARDVLKTGDTLTL